MPLKAIIAGSTGLVGSHLLQLLLQEEHFGPITLLLRKPLAEALPGVEVIHTDFSDLSRDLRDTEADIIFSCLGTTRKNTPDLQQYYRIDHDYPVELAEIAVQKHISQFHYISALGANASSSIFYLKTKGQAEKDLAGKNIPSIYLYRPSAITGDRKIKRPTEQFSLKLMTFFNPLMVGPLKRYRSIPAETIARSMVWHALHPQEGVHILESEKIAIG